MTPPGERSADRLPEAAQRAISDLRRMAPPPDLLRSVVDEVRATPQRRRLLGFGAGPVLLGVAAAALLLSVVVLPRLPALLPGATGPSGLPIGGATEVRVPVARGAHPASADAQSIWLGDEGTGGVIRLDAATGVTVGRIQVNEPTSEPYDLWPATDGALVWAAGRDDLSLVRIEIASMQATARWPIDAVAYRILPAGDVVWVSDFDGGRVLKIDATDGRVLGSVAIGRPTGLAMSGRALWVADFVGDVYEVDPVGLAVVERYDIASRATDLLVDDRSLLVWGIDPRPLERFDTDARAVVASQAGITAAAMVRDQLWGAWDIGAMARLDRSTLGFVAAAPLGPGATDQLVASGDRLWAYRGAEDGTFIEAVRPLP